MNSTPTCIAGSPLPPSVTIPSTKSVFSSGIGTGFHRIWFGGDGASVKGPLRNNPRPSPDPISANGLCVTDGRIRYVHVRRFVARGAVNAVPLNCSVYNPSGAFCGEFCPSGSAPFTASVANSFPNPD